MKKYIKLMRIQHYIKNGLIFFPLIFSAKLFNTELSISALFAFFAFSLTSSIVYVINDIRDVESDKRHPKKCKRPIASGEISVNSALILTGVLAILALTLNYISGGKTLLPWLIIGTYFISNLLYSLGLKNYPIIDVAILALGFLLRVLYGAAVTGIVVSSWLYLTVISIAFYLGLGKRRNELARISKSGDTRKVLESYNYNFLDKNMYMCLTIGIIFYSLWAIDTSVNASNVMSTFVWTVPIVLLICMKYNLTIEGESDGDPVEVLLHDKTLIALVLVFSIIVGLSIYG